MKSRTGLSDAKLRGGFYSPPGLVADCLDRALALLGDRCELRVLEPSAGDGAFLRGLGRHPLGERVARVEAVEPDAAAAEACRAALVAAGFAGRVVGTSALAWEGGGFDVALGNPPFLRYQFVSPADQAAANALAARLGVALRGVANLWIPVLLRALDALKPGGAFAFILPAELMTGISAGAARGWLGAHTEALRLDLYPAGSFPGVLQEVVVLSGRRGSGSPYVTVAEGSRQWTRSPAPDAPTWTPLLLTPWQAAAWDAARTLPAVKPLGTLARIEVAIVTGANAYFSVTRAVRDARGLTPWAKPLLPRIRHAPGLVFEAAEHERLAAAGEASWLLHFGPDAPDPEASPLPAAYLREGEAQGLPTRHKCAIRTPWWRVPGTQVKAGALLLSKRAHHHPRLILNKMGVLTTDTIYRGAMRPDAPIAAGDLVAAFHCGLTLLGAELEGRSFGGGVLELVPSEIARLPVFAVPGLGAGLRALDAVARAGGEASGALADATDSHLGRASTGLEPAVADALREAQRALQARRLARG